MSAPSEAPPAASSSASQTKPAFRELMRDIIMWRNKYLNIVVLLAATAAWVALQLFEFNFITVAAWVAMFVVAFLFIWGNINRLLRKEALEVSGMEISESSAVEIANGIREWVEEGIRWMFRVSSASNSREWFVFASTVASSWLLSQIGSRFDLLTILYIGLLTGMTAPLIYVKYEHKFKEYGWRLRMQSQKWHGKINDKVRRIKNRVAAGKKKEKKT